MICHASFNFSVIVLFFFCFCFGEIIAEKGNGSEELCLGKVGSKLGEWDVVIVAFWCDCGSRKRRLDVDGRKRSWSGLGSVRVQCVVCCDRKRMKEEKRKVVLSKF